MRMNRGRPRLMLLLAALCLATYAATLNVPLFEDEYPTLTLAAQYGAPHQAAALYQNPIYRTRATTYWVMAAVARVSGLAPAGFRLASLIFHILATWLVYGLARMWTPMRPAALWAALLFAVAEGHQEAVIWFAGFTEPAMLVFGLASVLCWLRAGQSARGWFWETASVLLFALALISKETAPILLPLFLLTIPRADWRRALIRLIPHVLLASIVAASILALSGHSFRFADGSFSLHAPFWITWPRGMARLLWVWGWLALAVIAWARDRALWTAAALALAWAGLALAPYSFLTYSTQIPSRQTYLASVGLALLFGLAVARLETVPKLSRTLVIAIVVVALAQNVLFIWLRKRRQFFERAQPTEQLIRTARRYGGPIWVQCFPRNHWIAEAAVFWGAGLPPDSLVWTAEEARERHAAVVFCFRGPGQFKR
jgi:Dolichyl-phosphate-mannose-protein mannosyltransferase